MKLLEVIRMINESQFLIERDVINAKELKNWAKESAGRITDPQAATWYASQLFKFLINRYEGARIAELGDFDGDPPEWVIAKFQAGEGKDILYIDPQQELRQQAEGVIDWLNAQAAENESLNLRMTWEDAVEAQHEWHRDIARQSRVTELTAEQMEGVVTIMEFDDGFRWVDVQTEVCLKHEGTVMGHCVGAGGYTQGVKAGTTKILSLRDGNNNPHATIEGVSEHPIHITADMLGSTQADLFIDNALEQSFVDMKINQIKGKENKPVVRKYRDYILDFLTKFQIEKFNDYGLRDLENSGLFKLHDYGFAPIEQVGTEMVKMEDGTSWHRVTNDEVVLKDYNDYLAAKWFLHDKAGRSIGDMVEKEEGIVYSIGYSLTHHAKEALAYRDHIIKAFAGGLRSDSNLYRDMRSTFNMLDIGVGASLNAGYPQTVGRVKGESDAGTIVITASSNPADKGGFYWLMNGDNIRSRFQLTTRFDTGSYALIFDEKHGLPSGSMPTFLKQFEATFESGNVKVDNIIVEGNRVINVNEMTWEPSSKDELVMEEDGVKFYKNEKGWYNAIDGHNHLIFNANIDGNVVNTGNAFKVKMVSDRKVAGYYAVYLVEHMLETTDLDIGEFTDYSSFARELLDETEWFRGLRSNTWYVMDSSFKIHFTETHSYDDGSEEDVYDDDTTMQHYWDETNLHDSGLENDYFAGEYEHVYRNGNIGYDDEHDGYGEEYEGGLEHVRTDYYVEGIGDSATVTHPVDGGSVRVQK